MKENREAIYLIRVQTQFNIIGLLNLILGKFLFLWGE